MLSKLIYANGKLSDDAFVAGLEALPPKAETTLLNLFQAHIVGLQDFTAEADAIGAWIATGENGDILYLDPVAITWANESAQELTKREGQKAYFKVTGVQHMENCNETRLLFVLTRVAKKYGGATALKTYNGDWVVVACAGEVVYL